MLILWTSFQSFAQNAYSSLVTTDLASLLYVIANLLLLKKAYSCSKFCYTQLIVYIINY